MTLELSARLESISTVKNIECAQKVGAERPGNEILMRFRLWVLANMFQDAPNYIKEPST